MNPGRVQVPRLDVHSVAPPTAEETAGLSTELALLINPTGEILWADTRAERVLLDPVGRRLGDLVLPGDEDKADRFLRAAQVDGGSEPWELGLVGAAGPGTVRLRGAPHGDAILVVGAVLPGGYGTLLADAGDLMGDLIVLQRESEQQRRELADAMESLRRAQAELVQGEQLRALGLLVASVAHEANNPLAFAVAGIEEADRIATFALSLLTAYRSVADPGEVVARLEADPEARYLDDLRDTLADARDGLERVRTLVLDLRTFARWDEAERKPVDLAATLRATLRVGGTAVGPGVHVEVDFAELPPLDCAPARVNQAVLNLFTNATRAAAPQGTVRVALREDAAGAVVEVEDSGPGVPVHLRQQIFEQFYTTQTSSGGMGLGLHLAREAARASGGDLTVGDSHLGGALFRLTLPRPTTGSPR